MSTPTTTERRQRAAYVRDFVPAIAGYLIVLTAVLALVGDRVEGAGEWVLLLLPLVPALWGVRAVARHLGRVDEYQRSLQLEAMATGFGVAMVAALTIGFVGVGAEGGGFLRGAGWIVYASGMATWAIVATVQGRRR